MIISPSPFHNNAGIIDLHIWISHAEYSNNNIQWKQHRTEVLQGLINGSEKGGTEGKICRKAMKDSAQKNRWGILVEPDSMCRTVAALLYNQLRV